MAKTRRRPRPNPGSGFVPPTPTTRKRDKAKVRVATSSLENGHRAELIRLAEQHKYGPWYWSWYRMAIFGNDPTQKLTDLSDEDLRSCVQAMNNLGHALKHPQLGHAIQQIYGFGLDSVEQSQFVRQLTDPEIDKLLRVCNALNQGEL